MNNKKICFSDYNNSTLNMMSSILNHYHVNCDYNTICELDEKIKNANNICLIILDGLGNNNLDNAVRKGFFQDNKIKIISSVFPSTTVAAISTISSALPPISHGLLGWTLRFTEVNKQIEVFRNRYARSDEIVTIDYMKIMKYKNIFTKIKEVCDTKCFYFKPSSIITTMEDSENIGYKNLKSGLKQLVNTLKDQNNTFTYFYHDYPDKLMHIKGSKSLVTKLKIRKIQRLIAKAKNKLPNTTFIISADHGLTEINKRIDITNDPKYKKMFSHHPSIESRACAFFIKNKYLEEFKKEFVNDYGDDFILYSKEEVLAKELFGSGEKHFKVDSFLGDYLAVAKSGAMISKKGKNTKEFKASHAGITEDETRVPLIVF